MGQDKLQDAVSDEEEGPQLDMNDMYDEVDVWDQERDADVAATLKLNRKKKEKGDMEMYALSGTDSDSDLELPKMNKKGKIKISSVEEARKQAKAELDMLDEDFMGSDVEGVDEEDPGRVGAWGYKKQHYYGGNTGYRMTTEDSGGEDHFSEEEFEEKEAKLIQNKQIDRLQEQDFMDAFGVEEQVLEPEKSKEVVEESVVAPDLSKLSSKEQAKMFRQQNPEFDGIVLDFKERIAEATKLAKIVQFEDEGLLPKGPITEYVRTKFQILTNYCTNISAYLMFKAKGTNLKLHPVVGRLVEYKHLLDSLEEKDSIIMPQIESLLSRLDAGESIQDIVKEERRRIKKKAKKSKQSSKLKLLKSKEEEKESSEVSEAPAEEKKKKHDRKRKLGEDLTAEEQMAVQLYQAIKRNKGVEEEQESEGSDTEETNTDAKVHPMLNDEEVDVDDPNEDQEQGTDGKRAINYQIAKNKGLTPKRNKLNRNPRVKHRHKFQQANKKRKGAVREVRKEISRYGGEISGINARVRKGTKIQ